MPITPADIHNVAFGKATLGKRGYDEEQVDALLDEVSMEMIGLLEENAELERRADGAPAAPAPADTGAEAELAALAAELNRALQARARAEERADGLRRELDRARQAPAAAPSVVPPESVGRVLAMAQHTADQHLNDAHRESEAVIAEAREKSGRMTHEAREKAGDIEREALRRHAEAVTALETRHAQALRDIGEMTDFAAGYQSALQEHIGRQTQLLSDAPRP